MGSSRRDGRLDAAIGIVLLVLTALTYGAVRHHEFVNYDDPAYVADNPHVRAGLTWAGVRWALGTTHAGNWHPLTWISHMADVELFGLDPGAHHLVNLGLHLANALLVFAVLRRMTGARWPSAFVAGAFALHPLHVESVAWVAERKDVLSAMLWLITLGAYERYARRPTAARYAVVGLLFALGLAAKPMLVTLPLVLLLLDFWPLRRTSLRRLMLEKVPLLALAAASSIVTIAAQHGAGAVHPWAAIPLGTRLGNAALSAIAYLGKCAWPLALAVPYPYPVSLSPAAVAGAAVAILAITLWAVRRADRRPYLIVGWAWYLITLVPVSGIVQVGDQALADRYTYLPLLGIFVALAWAVADAVHGRPRLRVWAAAGAAASLAAMAILAARQVAVWADTVTLFQNAVRATRGNYVAHTYLGIALAERGRTAEAIHHLEAVEAMDVAFPDAPHALGRILERSGDVDGAAVRYRRALAMQSDHQASLVDLGRLLAASGALEQALSHYEHALRLRPDDTRLLANLGIVLTRLGRPVEGVAPLERAVALEPGDLESRTALAAAYLDAGRLEEAERTLRTVLERDPNHVAARANLGVAAQRAGRLDEAVSHFEQALRSEPGDARLLEALGDTRARLGDEEGARRAYEAALRTGVAGPEIREKLAFLNESARSGSPLPSAAE